MSSGGLTQSFINQQPESQAKGNPRDAAWRLHLLCCENQVMSDGSGCPLPRRIWRRMGLGDGTGQQKGDLCGT